MRQYAVIASEQQIDTLFPALQHAFAGRYNEKVSIERQLGAVYIDAGSEVSQSLASILGTFASAQSPGSEIMPNREERKRAVAQMNANFALEGLQPDPHDKALQKRFIDGTAKTDDLLQHAQEFADQARANIK